MKENAEGWSFEWGKGHTLKKSKESRGISRVWK